MTSAIELHRPPIFQPFLLDPYSVSPYLFTVRRKAGQDQYGEGTLVVTYRDGTTTVTLGEFPVITGGREPNSSEYGGLTPAMDWVGVEPMDMRSPGGDRGEMTMSRIVPWFRGFFDTAYQKRTCSLPPERTDPFMIHFGSKHLDASTGCIVVLERTEELRSLFNLAFARGSFVIRMADF